VTRRNIIAIQQTFAIFSSQFQKGCKVTVRTYDIRNYIFHTNPT